MNNRRRRNCIIRTSREAHDVVSDSQCFCAWIGKQTSIFMRLLRTIFGVLKGDNITVSQVALTSNFRLGVRGSFLGEHIIKRGLSIEKLKW